MVSELLISVPGVTDKISVLLAEAGGFVQRICRNVVNYCQNISQESVRLFQCALDDMETRALPSLEVLSSYLNSLIAHLAQLALELKALEELVSSIQSLTNDEINLVFHFLN